MKRLASLLVAACALSACTGKQPGAQPSPSPSRSPGALGKGPWLHITGYGTPTRPVRFVQQLGNRKQYDLIAQSYESVGKQGSSVATFFTVHVTFYGKDGSKLVADAARAIVDQTANTITLMDNVHARTSSGMTLDCQRLRYDRTTELVHGEGDVVMADAHGMRATGNSVVSDITLTRTRMQ